MWNEAHAAGLPIVGSTVAGSYDALYNFLVVLSGFFFLLIVGGMIYFAIRYRRQTGKKSKYISGNHTLEILWTVIPTILLLVIFGWGYFVYNQMTRAPADAYEVRVIGKQWLWQFQYDDGRVTVGDVFVPVNKPVKFLMTSEDVLHSFFIPNFRVKQDVVPGMYTAVWFEATIPGAHKVFCTEYCGASHSEMLATVNVLDAKQWEDWKRGKKIENIPAIGVGGMQLTSTTEPGAKVQGKDVRTTSGPSLAEQGKKLMQTKGCIACHSDDGTKKIGPSYKGIFGHDVELADGSKVKVDENYIRESIENPNAKIVKGFAPSMPPFKGLVNETEMNALIAYIKSLQ